MSDSDAEFEKFLQESLSSSSASYQSFLSQLSRSGRLQHSISTSHAAGLKQWWNDASTSDAELDVVAKSWLKSSLPTTGGSGLLLGAQSAPENQTLERSATNYTKDSLEGSNIMKDDTKSISRQSSKTRHNGDFEDAFSHTEGSSRGPLLHTGPEENADKRMFFEELERDRTSPIDYSELNRQLGDTGRSSESLRTTYMYKGRLLEATEDQDKTPTQSDSETEGTLGSSHGGESSEQRAQIFRPTHAGTIPEKGSLHGSILSPVRTTTTTGINTSLLHRRDQKDTSPAHPKTETKEDSGMSPEIGSGSIPAVTEQRGLQPIHAKTELTASGHFKSSMKPQVTKPLHKDVVTLSPLHVQVQNTPTVPKTGRETTYSSASESKDLTLSPLHAVTSSPIRERTEPAGAGESGRRIHVHVPVDVGPHPLTVSQTKHSPERAVKDGELDKDAGSMSSQTSEGVQEDGSLSQTSDLSDYERDLVELQTALDAAGLPGLGEHLNTTAETTKLSQDDEVSEKRLAAPLEHSHLNMEETLRTIAAEELASLTKEILLRENQPLSDELDPGHDMSMGSTETSRGDKRREFELSPVDITNRDPHRATDSRVPSSSIARATDSRVPSSSMALATDSRVPSSSMARATDSGVPSSSMARATDSGVPSSSMARATDSRVPSSSMARATDSRVPSSSMARATDSRVPSSSMARATDSRVPSSSKARATDSRVPSSSMARATDSRVPSSSKAQVTDSGVPSSSMAPERVVPSSSRAPERGGVEFPSSRVTNSVQKKASSSARERSGSGKKGGVGAPSINSGDKSRERHLSSSVAQRRAPRPVASSPGTTGLKTNKKNLPISTSTRKAHTSKTDSQRAPPRLSSAAPVASLPNVLESSNNENTQGHVSPRSSLQSLPDTKVSSIESRSHYKDLVLHRVTRRQATWHEDKADLESREEEFSQREREMKEEILALTAKVHELELAQQSRSRLVAGTLTEEEKRALQRDVREQETLLQGYQKENERLYQKLGSSQKELKSVRAQLFEENQRLTAELLNARSQEERQSHGVPGAVAKISQLETRLEQTEQANATLENQVNQLQEVNHSLKGQLSSERKTREGLEGQLSSERKTREGLEGQLSSERKTREGLEGQLSSERKTREGLEGQLSSERKTREGLEDQLSSERKTREGLEGQLSSERKTREGLEGQLSSEKRTTEGLQDHLSGREGELKQTTEGFKEEVSSLQEEVSSLQEEVSSLQEEVASLRAKLQWYAENQRLLDQDCAVIRAKEKEIEQLKEKLANSVDPSTMEQRTTKGRAASARRIQDLERQVKEMEAIIQRRFPNSISALILASGKTSTEGGSEEKRRSTHLEGRVQQLEELVESKDQESARKMRALQQKYSAMEVMYERQITSLKERQHSHTTPSHPHTTVHALERELASVREKHQVTISELQAEIRRLKEELKVGGRGEVVKQREPERGSLEEQVECLQAECDDLKRERSSYQPAEWQDRELESVLQENQLLKGKLSQLEFELAHQRVQLQGHLAQAEGRIRQLQEGMEDRVSSLHKDHSEKVDVLIARFAQQHSESEVPRLQHKVTTLEAVVSHLRDQMETARMDSELLATSRSRKEELSQHVKTLTDELLEAKRYQTPEMHHFKALQAKITGLEARTSDYDTRMKEYRQWLQKPSEGKIKELEHKWAKHLQAKNAEIEQFKQELDSILDVLQLLQQGAVAR